MRKSTLFVSTALTMFALSVMFGVAKAYQQITASNATATKQEPVVMESIPTIEPTPGQPGIVSPEQATTIAVEFLGETDVYSVEVVDYQGVPAFLVTFSSGQLIYVSPKGEIIGISKLEPVVVTLPPKRTNNGGGSNTGGGGVTTTTSHNDHEGDD